MECVAGSCKTQALKAGEAALRAKLKGEGLTDDEVERSIKYIKRQFINRPPKRGGKGGGGGKPPTVQVPPTYKEGDLVKDDRTGKYCLVESAGEPDWDDPDRKQELELRELSKEEFDEEVERRRQPSGGYIM